MPYGKARASGRLEQIEEYRQVIGRLLPISATPNEVLWDRSSTFSARGEEKEALKRLPIRARKGSRAWRLSKSREIISKKKPQTQKNQKMLLGSVIKEKNCYREINSRISARWQSEIRVSAKKSKRRTRVLRKQEKDAEKSRNKKWVKSLSNCSTRN